MVRTHGRGRRGRNRRREAGRRAAGWKAALKGGQFAVSGVPVTPDRPRLLTFTAEPEKSLRSLEFTTRIPHHGKDRGDWACHHRPARFSPLRPNGRQALRLAS